MANIVEDKRFLTLLDRNQRIMDLAERVIALHRPNLRNRNPTPAYIRNPSGEFEQYHSGLDMISVLMMIAQRSGIVNIEEYFRLRQKSSDPTEWVTGEQNRGGPLLGVKSNEESHSFNIRVVDRQVSKKDKGTFKTGFYRTFCVLDDNGNFYPGMDELSWWRTYEEDRLYRPFEDKKGKLVFAHFVNPQAAMAYYGRPHQIAKPLEKRVTDQKKFYAGIAEDLRDRGITLGGASIDESLRRIPSEKKRDGPTDSITVNVFESMVVMPEFIGQYPIIGADDIINSKLVGARKWSRMPTNKDNLRRVLRYSEWVTKQLRRQQYDLRNIIRSVELAFRQYGFKEKGYQPGTEKKPGWEIPQWERGYTLPGKNVQWNTKRWNALKYHDDYRLLYRMVYKSITVDAHAPILTQQPIADTLRQILRERGHAS